MSPSSQNKSRLLDQELQNLNFGIIFIICYSLWFNKYEFSGRHKVTVVKQGLHISMQCTYSLLSRGTMKLPVLLTSFRTSPSTNYFYKSSLIMEPGCVWDRSLKFFDANIWNNLPYHIKSDKLKIFKSLIENWNEKSSECILSKNDNFHCCVVEGKVIFF